MYSISTYIYHINQPNVGRCTIHGSLGTAKPKDVVFSFADRHALRVDVAIMCRGKLGSFGVGGTASARVG